MIDDNEKSLQARLAEYQKAIEAEFEISDKHGEGLNVTNIAEQTREMLTRAVPVAVSRLIHLVEHADKETTQLSAAKYVLDAALGKGKIPGVDDPMTDLLKQIANTES